MNKAHEAALASTAGTARLFIFNQSMHWFMAGIIFPVLSLIILDKGMDYLQLGFLMAVYSGTVVLAELPSGALSDLIGRKKVYLAALCLSFGGGALALAASSFAALALGFVAMGLARAFSSGSVEALFIDRLYALEPGADLQPILARAGMAVPLALGLASLAGGYMPIVQAWLLPALRGPYTLNLLAYMALAACQLVLSAALVPADRAARGDGTRAGISGRGERPGATAPAPERLAGLIALARRLGGAFSAGLKNKTIAILLFGGLAWGFSISGLEQFWQPRVRDLASPDASSAILGFLGFGYFAASALGSMASTPLFRLSRRRFGLFLGFSRLLMGLLYLGLAAAGRLYAFSSLYILCFAANGLASSPEATLLNEELEPDTRATMLSLSSLFLQLGGLSGSIALGALARSLSIPAAWAFAALALILSSAFYFLLPRRHGKEGRL
jgi:predicted MFS family arabinose efflux permease